MLDAHLSWAVRASRAGTSAALDCLMDDWYNRVKADRGLHASIGFDASMESRDWDSAKHSIEQTHGRSSREHRQTLDTLAAAIQSRRMLTHRPAG